MYIYGVGGCKGKQIVLHYKYAPTVENPTIKRPIFQI